ncbi:MAG: TrpB-like pyridoxal phosphate-dependent enzyme [Clostridiales bacterium]|nr:TrpB-like pyridoxal phosphate-dependent enzyme [Candidatus Scatonaster coprocaballi]
MNKEPVRIILSEDELPRQWYDIRSDMVNKPAPYLNPATKEPLTFEDLTAIFGEEVVRQELSFDKPYVDIPEEVMDIYKMYRATPVIRAKRLEKKLGTPAHIYFKHEGENASNSHKLNSLVPQAYYAKKQGLKGIVTETAAGNVGTATSVASAFFDLECKICMVRVSYEQKAFRREVMKLFGADVISSPSTFTEIGKKINAEFPNTPGSLGCAISEAAEIATTQDGYAYVLGSMFSAVLMHQSIIGLETKKALEKYDIKPDIIIGCASGGSNFCGLASPFIGEKIKGINDYRIIAVEPEACPSLTRGKYAYDFCDTGMICPLAKMYTLGSQFVPSPIHAGGLRYHGMSPIVSQLYEDKLIEAVAISQTSAFDAAALFAKTEGIVPAPESSHAIKVAIDEALKCKETGEEKNILFVLSGTGYFDMPAYQKYNEHRIEDYKVSDEEIERLAKSIPTVE